MDAAINKSVIIPMTTHHREDSGGEQNGRDEGTITERTKVPLGLLFGSGGLIAVLIAGAVWFAVTLTDIRAELRNITSVVTKASDGVQSLDRRLSDHEKGDKVTAQAVETRLAVIERSGSPALSDLTKAITQLRVDFEVHKATQSNDEKKGNP